MTDESDDVTAWGVRGIPTEKWIQIRDRSRYGTIDPKARYGDRRRLPLPPSGRTPPPGVKR